MATTQELTLSCLNCFPLPSGMDAATAFISRSGQIGVNLQPQEGDSGSMKTAYYVADGELLPLPLLDLASAGYIYGCDHMNRFYGYQTIYGEDKPTIWLPIRGRLVPTVIECDFQAAITCVASCGRLYARVLGGPPVFWLITDTGKISSQPQEALPSDRMPLIIGDLDDTVPVAENRWGALLFELQPASTQVRGWRRNDTRGTRVDRGYSSIPLRQRSGLVLPREGKATKLEGYGLFHHSANCIDNDANVWGGTQHGRIACQIPICWQAPDYNQHILLTTPGGEMGSVAAIHPLGGQLGNVMPHSQRSKATWWKNDEAVFLQSCIDLSEGTFLTHALGASDEGNILAFSVNSEKEQALLVLSPV